MFCCVNSGNIFFLIIFIWFGIWGYVFILLYGLNYVLLKLYDIWLGVIMVIGFNVNKCCIFFMCCNMSLELIYGFMWFYIYSLSVVLWEESCKDLKVWCFMRFDVLLGS